jgi:hypothetical protein
VTRLLAAVNGPFRTIGCVVERHEVNGQPGEILRDGTARSSAPWRSTSWTGGSRRSAR